MSSPFITPGGGLPTGGSLLPGIANGPAFGVPGVIAGTVQQGIGSAIGSALGGAASTIGTIVGAIASVVGEIETVIQQIETPIADAFHKVTSLVQSIQDNLITPIVSPIETAIKEYQTLSSELTQDLHSGLTGILKIPGDLANALTATDASFQRAIEALGNNNKSLVTDDLVPGLLRSGMEPLAALGALLAPTVPPETTAAVFDAVDHLAENQPPADAENILKTVEQWFNTQTGVLAPLMHGFWTMLSAWELIGLRLRATAVQYSQYLNSNTPTNLIDTATTIEAWRRGVLTADNAREELAKQGWDPTRIQALYDTAQFLFSPPEAARLRVREQITDDEYYQIQAQNNLDQGQADAMKHLLDFIFSLGDLAALNLRGQITDELYLQQTTLLGVSGDDALLARELATAVVNPRAAVAASGRTANRGAAPLGSTLSTGPSAEILTAYRAAQQAPGQADIDWLMHWRIPPADWWVQAYYRGIRTRTDLNNAFGWENIPSELWDDILAVNEELPPVWLVPDIVASGVWTKEQAVPTLQKLGYSAENAEVLYNYGASKGKTTLSDTAAALQGLSLSATASLYADGTIDANTYQSILLAHGYGAEAATLTVELADLTNAAAKRKAAAEQAVTEVKLGVLDYDGMVSNLYAAGYTQAEVEQYALEARNALTAQTKLPTQAELTKMLAAGVIDLDTWKSTMQQLGYAPVWVDRLAALLPGATSG
jgi:hypothetical protein